MYVKKNNNLLDNQGSLQFCRATAFSLLSKWYRFGLRRPVNFEILPSESDSSIIGLFIIAHWYARVHVWRGIGEVVANGIVYGYRVPRSE